MPGARIASGPRTQFLLECLAELDEKLRVRGGRLVVRRGRPERELPRLWQLCESLLDRAGIPPDSASTPPG